MDIREEELYGDIVQWLDRYLRENIPDKDFVIVVDSHNEYLCDSISKVINFHIQENIRGKYRGALPNDYISWYIKVDIYGLVGISGKLKIILVEIKSSEVTLEHVAQLIGYTRIVKPELAILISPKGVSQSLYRLLVQYKRLDILEYVDRANRKRKINIVKWNINKKDIEYISHLPTQLHIDIKML